MKEGRREKQFSCETSDRLIDGSVLFCDPVERTSLFTCSQKGTEGGGLVFSCTLAEMIKVSGALFTVEIFSGTR